MNHVNTPVSLGVRGTLITLIAKLAGKKGRASLRKPGRSLVPTRLTDGGLAGGLAVEPDRRERHGNWFGIEGYLRLSV